MKLVFLIKNENWGGFDDHLIALLDEPSTGLDIISQKELISSIKKLKGTITIIIISHKKEILSICDKNFEFSKNGLKEI